MQVTNTILKDFSLRNTNSRQDILTVFINNDFALAHADIESRVKDQYDRVTVYRTLKTFLDKGIIHKVLDDEGTTKYALCKERCSADDHDHEHVHFKCVKCNNTSCLDGIEVPNVKLPEGYTFKEANLLVQGICQNCQ